MTGTRVEGGIHLLDVQPWTFTLEALAPGGLFLRKEIRLERGQYENEIELILQKDKPAHLLLFLSDPSGRLLRNADGFVIRAGCFTGEEATIAMSGLERNTDGAFAADLPPDAHRLLVVPGGKDVFYLPTEENYLRIKPGEETTVSLSLEMGGRFQIDFDPPLPEKRDPRKGVRIYKWTAWGSREHLESYAFFVPGQELPYINTRFYGPDLHNDIFVEGRFRLIAERDGYARVQEDFVIMRGETTHLKIRFQPE